MTDDSSSALAERRGMETRVYQPAEDSGLLASAVLERGRGRLLEVGTGSGWVAARAAREADDVSEVVASDLSPHACRAARERAREGPDADEAGRTPTTAFEVVRGSLVEPFAAETFDTVAFNPPYLPTDPDNEWDDWMERALSGGESGRELVDPFLDTVARVLTADGLVLLLVSSLTGYDEVLSYAANCGFDHEVVVEESYPFETLTVVGLTPKNN
nr:HemK2/MTQ2 family protein methyltransferase [Halobellus clavatus]